MDDSSDSELDDGAKSYVSEAMNYRLWGDCKVKKRKVSGAKKEKGSDDGDNWRPVKDFPGLNAKAKNKKETRKVFQDGEGLLPRKRRHPPKFKKSERKVGDKMQSNSVSKEVEGKSGSGHPPNFYSKFFSCKITSYYE